MRLRVLLMVMTIIMASFTAFAPAAVADERSCHAVGPAYVCWPPI